MLYTFREVKFAPKGAVTEPLLVLSNAFHFPEGTFRLVKRRDPASSLRHVSLKIHRHQARKMTRKL